MNKTTADGPYHSFTVYTNKNVIRMSTTQFAHEADGVRIISDAGVHLSKEEATRLAEMLQGAIEEMD